MQLGGTPQCRVYAQVQGVRPNAPQIGANFRIAIRLILEDSSRLPYPVDPYSAIYDASVEGTPQCNFLQFSDQY